MFNLHVYRSKVYYNPVQERFILCRNGVIKYVDFQFFGLISFKTLMLMLMLMLMLVSKKT
jgi:hypothetical protein